MNLVYIIKKYRDYNVNCKLNFKSIKSKVYINYFTKIITKYTISIFYFKI